MAVTDATAATPPPVIKGFQRVLCGHCSKFLCLATPGSVLSIKCRGCTNYTIIAVPPLDKADKRQEGSPT